ncbi:MAG TPA: manganese efflux pump [Candidatus Aphodovivens avistercoris]|nr:manganese efflux pump [Candidatus Aphodovivens avistercoris]
MGFAELFLVAVGLSMDAFAVAICKGLGMPRLDLRQAAVIAAFFGGFQALMPVAGWLLGVQFESLITPVDHWVAFALLAFIGGKMLFDALRGEDEGDCACADAAADAGAAGAASRLDLKEIALLAVATSIDALAVGITFAFLQVDIAPAAGLIGATTFCLSLAGVAIGHQFGARFEKPATIVGGVVLILIGLKILLEHLGVLAL